MARVCHHSFTKLDKDGVRRSYLTKAWYIEYQGADKKTHREKVGMDKRLAMSALARAVEREARKKHGVPDPSAVADQQNSPLLPLFTEYLALLVGRDTGEEYRATLGVRLDAMAVGCGWLVWSDIRADGLQVFLGKLRDKKKGKHDRGVGLSTLNGYLRAAKSFCNWYADRLGVTSPLRKLKPYPEKKDRRRSTRVLTDAELGRLIAAAESAPKRFGTTITGPMRAALYRVAAYTGLRASELNTLTPTHFRLDADTPVVVVEAADAKGKREDPIPLPGHLVEFLRAWFAGKKPAALLWPGDWAKQKRQVKWLTRDAKRAGLGEGVLFHGLKRKYVTGLIRTGADIDEVRRMARHKHLSTTLDYYAQSDLPDLKKAADRLPPPG